MNWIQICVFQKHVKSFDLKNYCKFPLNIIQKNTLNTKIICKIAKAIEVKIMRNVMSYNMNLSHKI